MIGRTEVGALVMGLLLVTGLGALAAALAGCRPAASGMGAPVPELSIFTVALA